MNVTIAFNTANLVAHYSGYHFQLADWVKQHQQVVERTHLAEWTDICQRIRAAGYNAVEVWVALIEKCAGDESRAAAFSQVLKDHHLTPVALAGPLNDTTGQLCQRFGIPCACGGYWGSDKPNTLRVMRDTGVLFNYENHPETSIEEIRAQIALGAHGFALALDTGWLVTRNIEAPRAVRELGRLIRHVHLKDVAAPGGHATVKLGTGVADIPGIVRELKAIGYTGVLSWEDEPEDRNPWDIAAEMRQYIEQLWHK